MRDDSMSEKTLGKIGTPPELGTVFQQNFPWLVRYLGRHLGSRERGEDAASEVFVRLAGTRQIDTVREPRAYLLVVARRLIAELRGRGLLESSYLDALSRTPEMRSTSPEAIASHLQEVRTIDAALATLSPRARMACVMHRIDGRQHGEIAAQLGVSISMVRKYIAMAERACRARLDE